MDLKGKKINFLGDSITQGCGTSNEETKRFSKLIEISEGAICRNYGIGGTRIARQQTPSDAIWDRDFCSRVDTMDPDADIVVVFGGTNDFGHGDAPIGKMDDRTPDTFYGALHTLFESLIVKYINSDIVIITPIHRCNEMNPRGDGNKPSDVGTLEDYVKIIREVAEFYSLPILDLYKTSGLQPRVPEIKEKYVSDGLHPNDEGHKILAKKIVNYLKTL